MIQEEAEKLIDMDEVIRNAVKRTENNGIIFIDEIDKIASDTHGSGPDVSREGVQRDILPIIEGCTVSTKYGQIQTDHVLFICAGAFHISKPSDLIPELQGRLPIRVEMDNLTKKDFIKILTKPENALIKQYQALFEMEDVKLSFRDDAIDAMVNDAIKHETGARGLRTVMEATLLDIMYEFTELWLEYKVGITTDHP